jgi:hypothetical protein
MTNTITDSSGKTWYVHGGILKPAEVLVWKSEYPGFFLPRLLPGLPDYSLVV